MLKPKTEAQATFFRQAFFACIKSAFLGSLLFPFWLLVFGLISGETVNIYQAVFWSQSLLLAGFAFVVSVIMMTVLGLPNLLILNKHNINHPLTAALSAFLFVAIILFAFFGDFYADKAWTGGLMLCLSGATYGFIASYLSRK